MKEAQKRSQRWSAANNLQHYQLVLSSSFDQNAPVAIRQRLLEMTYFQLGVGQNDLQMDPKWVMSCDVYTDLLRDQPGLVDPPGLQF